jgi:hypothetical protein
MSNLWVKVNYSSMASLVRLLEMRHPEDDAVKTLREHFDKAVADGDFKEYICTKDGCPGRTNE